jgi:hypothetical protein
VQLNHPTDQAESLGFGLEYRYREWMFVRSGYEHQSGSGQGLSWGLGWRIPRAYGVLQLDYAFVGRSGLGPTHRLGLMWSGGKRQEVL